MKRVANAGVCVLVLCSATGWCLGQEPGPNYEQLKFLEPLVGNWKVVTTEGDKIVSDGQEASEWILNKSFMKHVGWGQHEGELAHYIFYTGWNPKTEKVFQWSIGATDSLFGISERIGSYDPAGRVWTSDTQLLLSDGNRPTSVVKIKFVDDHKITIDFLQRRSGSSVLPNQHDTFTRAPVVAAPALDSNLGPGYEHLKFLDFSVGKWKLAGTLPNQGEWVGEEVNEWMFDENFMHTRGWGKVGGGERFDYELFIGWDPAKEKVFMKIIDSDGGMASREGSYDPERKCLTSRQTALAVSGVESSSTVVEQYVDNDHFILRFSEGVKDGRPQPAFEVKATRIRP